MLEKLGSISIDFLFCKGITCFFFRSVNFMTSQPSSLLFWLTSHVHFQFFHHWKRGSEWISSGKPLKVPPFFRIMLKAGWREKKSSTVSCEGQPCPGFLWIYILNISLAILCALFGMVKWPFQRVKWPPIRGWKGHFESPGVCNFALFCSRLFSYFHYHVTSCFFTYFVNVHMFLT